MAIITNQGVTTEEMSEFFMSMSEEEKMDMLDILSDYFKIKIPNWRNSNGTSFMEEDHIEYCKNLSNNYQRISNEDLEIIKKISDKL